MFMYNRYLINEKLDFHSVFACLLGFDCCFFWYIIHIHKQYSFQFITQISQVSRTFFVGYIYIRFSKSQVGTGPLVPMPVSAHDLLFSPIQIVLNNNTTHTRYVTQFARILRIFFGQGSKLVCCFHNNTGMHFLVLNFCQEL